MKSASIVSIRTSAVACVAVLSLASAVPAGQATADATAKPKGGPFPWQLTVYDRQGNIVRTVGELANESDPPAFSPDGTRLAVIKALPAAPGADISVSDLSTGASMRVMTGPAPRNPVWSPDGSQLAYLSYRPGYGGLYRKASNGTGNEELLYRFPPGVSDVHLTDWSPDGRFLVFDVSAVVWMLPLAGERPSTALTGSGSTGSGRPDPSTPLRVIPSLSRDEPAEGRKAIELMREDFQVFGARFSPDSRFLAYVSDESGRNEVYVRAFDPSLVRFSVGGKWRVSGQGGLGMVHWRGDGRELYYLAQDDGVMAVDVTTTPAFTAASPKLLFRAPTVITLEGKPDDDQYGRISRDGQRVAFQVLTPPERKVVTIAPETLARYTGTYVNSRENTSVVVTVEGPQLMVQGPTQKHPLLAESEASFFVRLPDHDADVELVKDDKGAVMQFLVYSGGPGTTWTRTQAKPRGGRFPRQLAVYDRQGSVMRIVGEPGQYTQPVLSPDGTLLAVIAIGDPARRRGGGRSTDPDAGLEFLTSSVLWVVNLSTGARTEVAAGPGLNRPVWSPDGRQIAYYFNSYRGYRGLYRKASNGTGREQLLYRSPLLHASMDITDWSADGRFLVLTSGGVLYVLPLTGERNAVELLREEARVDWARLSADSRFLAYVYDLNYVSNELGRNEVYIRAFDPSSVQFSPGGGKWQVSDQGGLSGMIQWRNDGKELFYLAADNGVMAVDVNTTPAFSTGPPRLLLRPPSTIPPAATAEHVSRDGRQLAFMVPMPPERNVVTVAPEILARYTGRYVSEDGQIGVLTLEGNQLMAEQPGGGPRCGSCAPGRFPLFPESETSFFDRHPDSDVDVEFVKDDKGAVTHFVVYSGGPGTRWTRQ